MGEAKRRKKLDPNFGSQRIKSRTEDQEIEKSIVLDSKEIRFTSSLGKYHLSYLNPPNPHLNRKFNMPPDCNWGAIVIFPKPHIKIEGIFFTKDTFSQAVLLGESTDVPEKKKEMNKLNTPSDLKQLVNEVVFVYKSVKRKRELYDVLIYQH